jgi:hypothetical protein
MSSFQSKHPLLLKFLAAFATIAFNVVIELEQFELEPTALNSNLFPKSKWRSSISICIV